MWVIWYSLYLFNLFLLIQSCHLPALCLIILQADASKYNLSYNNFYRSLQYVRTANESRTSTVSKECYADLVTEYDQKTEKMLIENLHNNYPSHK